MFHTLKAPASSASASSERTIDMFMMGIEALSDLMREASTNEHQQLQPFTVAQASDISHYLAVEVQRLREGA